MRRPFLVLAALALSACASPAVVPGPGPVSPTPAFLDLRGVVHVEGRWNVRVYMGQTPVLTLIEGEKAADITIMPRPPWATVDLIDPAATVAWSEKNAAAVADGSLLIRRGGAAVGLTAPPPTGDAPRTQPEWEAPTNTPK